jgi:hypothetical protein
MVLMQRSSIVGDEAARVGFDAVSECAMGLNRVAFCLFFWLTRVNAGGATKLQQGAGVGSGRIEQAPSQSW